ncbi:MAG: MarR family winged helix-turn-helix transcriptional regulator, partial [Bacillus sp. (in: firmicutes)]
MNDFLTLDKQLCFAVYETAGEFNKLYTSVLQPFGLTYPQYLVLLALWEKDALTVKELGEKLHLGTGTLTPMVARMEANGWLLKVRSKEDERKVHIHLQPKALEQKPLITEKLIEVIRSCNIDYEEYKQIMEMLKRLN